MIDNVPNTLFRNKKFMLDEMFQCRNAYILLEYENYMGFRIQKVLQIWKFFANTFHQA